MYRPVNVMKMEHNSVTNKWEKVPDGIAMLHQFGSDYEEFENGAGNFPVAIIERADGRVETPRADMVHFIQESPPCASIAMNREEYQALVDAAPTDRVPTRAPL